MEKGNPHRCPPLLSSGSRFAVAMALLLSSWLPLKVFTAEPSPSSTSIPSPTPAAGQTTVIWISMDGTRGDYLDRAPLPFFHRLMAEGVYSRRFYPVFPPITFPSHCAEATGVPVAQHGISGNSFYDAATRQTYGYPSDSSLLQAEPIWLTATRQGVRTAAFDWPLSQAEHGPLHAAYFNERFVNGPTDVQRLDHLLETWRQDRTTGQAAPEAHGAPLRLLMGYVEGADPVGHRYGPDAPEVTSELTRLDGELSAFADRALAQWKETASPADRFYLLLTTDHGMSKVEKFVNLEKLLGLPHGQREITLSTVGNIGNVHLDQIPAGPAREAQLAAFLEILRREAPFAHAYRREALPAGWGYAHPTRVGDIVVVLSKGYTFNKQNPQAVTELAAADTPKGMHGYPIEDDPEMYGATLIWRYPQLIGGKDLGEVYWDQYYPTVARWLGVQPVTAAKGRPIALPGE